jgi:hypothetical protein
MKQYSVSIGHRKGSFIREACKNLLESHGKLLDCVDWKCHLNNADVTKAKMAFGGRTNVYGIY